MPKQFPSLLRHRNLVLVAAAVVVPGTLALFLARTHAEERANAGSRVSSSQTVPVYKQRLRFWVHGDGIRPRIVHAKPGVVLLTCENKTIVNAELVVDRLLSNETIQALGSVVISRERGRGTQELLLAEGSYVVYERSRPEFRASLVVSP